MPATHFGFLRHVRLAGTILALFALACSAKAQSAEPACTPGLHRFIGYSVQRKDHFPFSATIKTRFEQTLPDGNHIRGAYETRQARDSEGRTLSEMAQGCRVDENGVPKLDLNVTVFDRTAETTLNWRTGPSTDKIARIHHMAAYAPSTRPPLTPEQLAARKSRQPQATFDQEDLGTRSIAGIEAHGTRTIRTIAAGVEGNELPLVTIHENWHSNELDLDLMVIDDDPRQGRTTMEVKELSRAEPDPSVFAPPEGYTIEDDKPATPQK